MKFDLFEQLRYLESHTKNSDEFNRRLRSMTQKDVHQQITALKQEEARDSRNCLTL